MIVEKKNMYHFHKSGRFDDVWKCGNTLHIDNNFQSNFIKILDDFNTNSVNGGSFCSEVSDYFERDSSKDVLDRILGAGQSRYELMNYLRQACNIIWEANIFKRELALEEVRKKSFSALPSRKHSVWVTDIDGLDFWEKVLKPVKNSPFHLSLFSVSLSGNLFKSNEELLPRDVHTFDECLKAAYGYWNPDFTLVDPSKNEYLFQGEMKILKRLL